MGIIEDETVVKKKLKSCLTGILEYSGGDGSTGR
jgi:hypothetical protein